MKFSVEFSKRAGKDLKNIDKITTKRCIIAIEKLKEDPFPRDAIKVKGEDNVFRIRIGKYRVLYEVYHETKTVLVVKIDKRERIYD